MLNKQNKYKIKQTKFINKQNTLLNYFAYFDILCLTI